MADPTTTRHRAVDGVAVGAADRSGMRVVVDQGGAARPRPAVRALRQPQHRPPWLRMGQRPPHRQAHSGDQRGRNQDRAGQGRESFLRDGVASCRA